MTPLAASTAAAARRASVLSTGTSEPWSRSVPRASLRLMDTGGRSERFSWAALAHDDPRWWDLSQELLVLYRARIDVAVPRRREFAADAMALVDLEYSADDDDSLAGWLGVAPSRAPHLRTIDRIADGRSVHVLDAGTRLSHLEHGVDLCLYRDGAHIWRTDDGGSLASAWFGPCWDEEAYLADFLLIPPDTPLLGDRAGCQRLLDDLREIAAAFRWRVARNLRVGPQPIGAGARDGVLRIPTPDSR